MNGGLKLNGSRSSLNASQVKVTVQLTNLKSQDTVPVPGLDVANRDRIVQRTLDTATYPTATLSAGSIQLPANAASGSRVTIPIQAQLSGGKVAVLGTIPVNMSDYGVQAPNLPLVAVQPQLQRQVQAFFARQAA
jgi:YceI-like domain